MLKKSVKLSTILLLGFFVGCSSSPSIQHIPTPPIAPVEESQSTSENSKSTSENSQSTSCHFPDSPMKVAPSWICDPTPMGNAITSLGSAENSKQGFAYTKQLATTTARWKLAQQLETRISESITTYTKLGDNGESKTFYHSALQQSTQKTMTGSRVLKSQLSPNRTLYVLMGIDKSQAQKLIESSLRSSYQANKSDWDQLLNNQADSVIGSISQSATQ